MISGRKIKCRTCGCTDMYETSVHYNPDLPLTGDQVQLQQPYRSYNWPTFEGALATKETGRFRMFCVRCMGLISTTGELHFVDPVADELILSNEEDSKIEDEPRERLVLTPEPEATYKEKMAQMRKKPKRSKRK